MMIEKIIVIALIVVIGISLTRMLAFLFAWMYCMGEIKSSFRKIVDKYVKE